MVVLCLVGLLAAACGTNKNSSTTAGPKVECASGSISGAGSTFVQNLAQQWIKDYTVACPGTTVNYQAVGSGAGIQQFTAGTVDFGASDATMSPTEEAAAVAKGGKVLHIPWSSGGIAIEYNVKGVKELNLAPATVAGIFAGRITKWDDPTIKADNQSANLPSEGIQVIHRSDGSGTTASFTSYLTAVAGSVWTAGAGKDVPWPTGQGAKGSSGVTAAVKQAEGAIGYAEVSFAKGGALPMAKVKNGAGNFVAPTDLAVEAALHNDEVPDDLKIKANYTPSDSAAYPISTVTWIILFQHPADPAKAKVLKSFVSYALGQGQNSATALDYAPLPSSVLDKARSAVASVQT